MSEFIIDATDAQLGDKFDARAFFGPRLHEEIVRCEDCRYSTCDGMCCWLYKFRHYEQMSDYTWEEMPADVEPQGFCMWGERRIIT